MTTSLISKFTHFKQQHSQPETSTFASLVKDGQHPKYMIISCADSRVDPALMFDTDPGDLFIVRNVANLVPACSEHPQADGVSSALEFAVKDLKVEHIIVMGHAHCGGIKAACLHHTGAPLSERTHISKWVENAASALTPLPKDKGAEFIQKQAEQASVKQSVHNLLSFSFIQERVHSGSLQLHGWWFDMDNLDLYGYDQDSQNADFVKISEPLKL